MLFHRLQRLVVPPFRSSGARWNVSYATGPRSFASQAPFVGDGDGTRGVGDGSVVKPAVVESAPLSATAGVETGPLVRLSPGLDVSDSLANNPQPAPGDAPSTQNHTPSTHNHTPSTHNHTPSTHNHTPSTPNEPDPLPTTNTYSHLADTKYISDVPYSARLFDVLGLSSFSETELKAAFDRLDKNGNGTIECDELREVVVEAFGPTQTREQVDAFVAEFLRQLAANDSKTSTATTKSKSGRQLVFKHHITYDEFQGQVMKQAESVDPRVWPIAFSMFLTGSAIGVIVPVMPLFVKTLGLSVADFGVVVSAFGLTKLLGNVPSAAVSDRIGRKPLLTGGMGLISLGMLGVSMSSSFEELIACRLVTGLGVSGFTTAATLYLTDVGTPLNRTKTMAPITASFSAGATMGPAIGGFMADAVGIGTTFSLVGGAFSLLALYNHVVLTETLTDKAKARTLGNVGGENILKSTFKQWGPLLRDARLRTILAMNFVYWLALSGSQMTLLPMMLVDPKFELSPSGVGGMFALMSSVGVFCAQPAGMLADKFGKPPVIIAACALISSATMMFPYASNYYEMVGLLTMWALGGTMVGMAPTAYVADLVPPASRSQALAMMRTVGDVGLLVGASSTGMMAMATSPGTAMQTNSSLLLATSLWFGYASLWRKQVAPGKRA